MIFLYSKLDIQNKGEGLGSLQDFVEEPIVTWNASGFLEVEFKYFLYGDLAEYMIPDAKLKTRIHSNDEVYHLFTIYEVEPDYIENTIQVRAEMTLLHELKDRVVPAGTMRGTANEMIMFVKNKMDRDYPFVITGTADKTVFIEHDNISAYELIFGEDGILKRTGAEIEFTDRGIRVSNRIGTIHRDELRESDFVTNLTVNELQGEDFVTRIIPFTTVMFDRPVRDGDRYTRETIETPTYGTPVISPNITNKLYKVRTKFVEYRNEPTEVPKYYNYQTDRGTETLEMSEYVYEDVTALNQDASTFFEDNIGIDEPTTTITIETLGLAKGYYTYLRYLNRYDIVTIYVEPKPYLTNSSETYVVQVNETVYEPLSDNLLSIGFTNESLSLQDAYRNVNEGRISDQQLQAELQKERLRDLEDKLVNYVYNHDGFRLEFGNVLPPPDEYREGDLYYLETGEGIDIYKLVNGTWEFLVGQSTREIIEGKIEEIEQQAEDLTKAIESSDQKADEAKEEAGLAKSAADALEIITQETADKMVDVEQLLADAESNASEALVQASEAASQAGQAVIDSQTAMDNAQSALSKASDTESTVSTLSSEFDEVAGKVELKAGKSEVDTLSGTVSTHTSTLSQHATAIASKAEQTEVDTISGTVSTHTSTLTQHAKDISARLTQSQVDNLVSGKGYSTTSYVDNQLSVTAKGIRNEITAVEGKIPTEIGGRNLLRDSDTFNPKTWERAEHAMIAEDEFGKYLYTTNYQHGNLIKGWGSNSEIVLEPNETYTYSIWVWSDVDFEISDPYLFLHAWIFKDGGTTASGRGEGVVAQGVVPKNKWTRVCVNYTVLDGNITFTPMIYSGAPSGATVKIRNMKLEKGSIPSDWSPSPADTLSQNDFTIYKNLFESSISGITTELSKTAKTTDLKGMVTETYLATNQYTKQGEINTQLQSYLKTTDLDGKIQTTSSFQNVKATTDRFTRVIGSTDEQAKSNIAQIAMSDSLFQTTVRKSINADSNNMIRNGNFQNGTESWTIKNASGSVVRKNNHGKIGMHLYGTPTHDFQGIVQDINPLSLEKGSQITVGFDATKDSTGGDLLIIVHWVMDGTIANQSTHVFNAANFSVQSYQRESVTLDVPVKCNSVRVMFYMNDVGKSHNIYLTDISVSRGNMDLGYSPHNDDKASSKSVSEIKQTADAVQLLVGTTNDSVARAVMTSSLWETEVSKVIDGELKQEYKTVTSKVTTVDGGKDINNGEGIGEGRYFYFNNSDGVVEGTLSRNATYTLEFSTQTFDNKGNAITLQVKPYGTTEWEPIVTGQMTAGTQINTFTFENDTFASSVSDYRLVINNVDGINVPYIWGFKLYEEVEVEVPIESENTGAISSQITQLYNMINLSVLGKEGALSRIAVGEEGIQIDGKLLHITAKTYIDDAVIKSAMIDTLDAGKITTGELNASLIRVVNLDANSIAGNEANFIKAMFSDKYSTLQITGNGVNILDNAGRSSTYLDSSGIEFTRQGIALGKLEYVTNISDSGDLNNMHGFSMRPNRNSYFGVSYFPTSGATSSLRCFAVSGRTGNIYLSGLLKPSEQHPYGLNITWGTITGGSTNVEIWNHNKTGGIHIANGDLHYISNGKWRSLNDWIK